jgi:hypothetical protein
VRSRNHNRRWRSLDRLAVVVLPRLDVLPPGEHEVPLSGVDRYNRVRIWLSALFLVTAAIWFAAYR